MSSKPDYYFSRTKEKIEKAGQSLDDAINITNRMVSVLTEAVNMYRLAVGALDWKLCHRCPKDAKYKSNGIDYCEAHWREEEKNLKVLEGKKEAKRQRQATKKTIG